MNTQKILRAAALVDLLRTAVRADLDDARPADPSRLVTFDESLGMRAELLDEVLNDAAMAQG